MPSKHQLVPSFEPVKKPKAYDDFIKRFPSYTTTTRIDELRSTEYWRLDEKNQVYLDYTGGGLHAENQVRDHMALLNEGVFGNPHSHNPTSLAATELVEKARKYVLAYFNAPKDEYLAIFTSNASGALKLIGESYPFTKEGRYALTSDNHNSVNGIREFARARGAKITYVPLTQPELRIDQMRLVEALKDAEADKPNLFAFPAQSNFTGVQHSLEYIQLAQELGWDVVVDFAAFAPTNRLDFKRWKPDFGVLSFYKIFGYPTGLGCLIMRREMLRKLMRPWFAGGTISIASVQADKHYLLEGEAAFEDGTVDYLNIPAVETGLRHIEGIGIDIIHERVICLTGWLLEELGKLHHENGVPLIKVHGPVTTESRGGTITVSFMDPYGIVLDERRIEELANQENISVRTGCFCNPGAGETAHGVTQEEMGYFFMKEKPVSFRELSQGMRSIFNKTVSAVRISVGVASNFDDVYKFMNFVCGFLNKRSENLGGVTSEEIEGQAIRDTP